MTDTPSPDRPQPALDVAAIERRCEAATPGPWASGRLIADQEGDYVVWKHRGKDEIENGGPQREFIGNVGSFIEPVFPSGEATMLFEGEKHDAEFIARARTDIPALLATVRDLQSKLHEWEITVPGSTIIGLNDEVKQLKATVRQQGARVAAFETSMPCGHAARYQDVVEYDLTPDGGKTAPICWACAADSEGSKKIAAEFERDDLKQRLAEVEAEREAYKNIITEEMTENVKLFQALGVMPEVEAGDKCSASLVTEGIERLKAENVALEAERDAWIAKCVSYENELFDQHGGPLGLRTRLATARHIVQAIHDQTSEAFIRTQAGQALAALTDAGAGRSTATDLLQHATGDFDLTPADDPPSGRSIPLRRFADNCQLVEMWELNRGKRYTGTVYYKADEVEATVRQQATWIEQLERELQTASTMQDGWDEMIQRLAALEADHKEAAGELMIEMPEPGTDLSKCMMANVIIRRQRDDISTRLGMRHLIHILRHLLIPGYRYYAARELFVWLLMCLTINRFTRVLRWFGKSNWILSRLPLTPEQIRLGQEIARSHGLKRSAPHDPG